MRRRVTGARLVGRTRELGDLIDAFERAVEGHPTVAIVGGEAGVGKTRLVSEFVAVARTRGATVASGGCVELGDLSLPFAPIVGVIRALARTLDPATMAGVLGPARDEAERLVPDLAAALDAIPRQPGWAPPTGSTGELERDVDPAARSVRLELLLGVIRRISSRAPLIVVLEDLHWADPSTLDLVAYVTRNLTTERLVLLATYRTDAIPPGHPLRHLAAELARDHRVERYELAPLDRDDVGALIAGLLGEAPDPDLQARVFARSDGNPFFAEELIAAELRAEAPSVPSDLRELILDRVRRMPDPAAAVVRIVALAGRGADDLILTELSGLTPTEVDGAIRAARDEGVLVTADDGSYAFRHALLGEAIAEDVLPGERRRLHAAFVTARSARPLPVGPGRAAEAADRARHWDAAGRPSEAFAASLVAADAAHELSGFAEAGAQLDRVLRLWDEVPDAAALAGSDRGGIASRAADAWSLAGEFDRAVELGRHAVELVDSSVDGGRAGMLKVRLASYLLNVNDENGALLFFDAGLLLLTGPGSAVARRRALVGRAAALMLQGRHRESADSCRAALAIDVPEMRWVAGQAHNYLGVDLVCLGELEAGLAELREARRVAASTDGPPETILEVDHNLACMLDRADRLDEAVAVALEGAARAQASGLGRRSGIGLRAVAAIALVRVGRWIEAEAILTECLGMAPRGEPALLVHQGLAALRVGSGDTVGALRHLDEARRLAAGGQRADSQPAIVAAAAELAIQAGRWDDAVGAITAEVDRLADLEDGYWIAPLVAPGIRAEAERSETIRATRATVGLERSAAAAEHLMGLLRASAERPGSPAPSTTAHSALAEAELTRLSGQADPQAWAATAAAFEAVPEPLRAAYARYREAEATLAARGGRERASAALARAVAVADRLGATPLRQAIDELAMRARIDLARGGPAGIDAPPATPTAGHGLGLTPRETEILGIVARGRTNRQVAEELFITEKTVGVHMTNILGKLGVPNRMDAAAIADRLGIGRRADRLAASDDGAPGAAGGGGTAGGHQHVHRAFLFTDIVRSTDLIGVIGDDAWADLRRWHDERLRSVFSAHHGDEIDHAGDGFLVSFERSADALDCAVEIQRALADHRRHHGFAPSVRIGIHASEATRSGTGFAGRAVHEGARIAALAGPDEILASLETVRDGRGRSGVSAPRTVRLKGIAGPVAIVTVQWRRG